MNSDLFIVEKILAFPSQIFIAPPENIFLGQVVHNFFQVSTLQITKLATDQGGDTLTLEKFKRSVRDAVIDEYRADFQSHLRRSRFGVRTRQMLEKARRLRDTRIAHFIRDQPGQVTAADQLTLAELQSLRDELNAQLDLLSFDVGHMKVPIPYHPGVGRPAGSDPRSDIEKFLTVTDFGGGS